MKIAVEPVSEDLIVPPHPVDGPLAAEGGAWTADQYTFRLIQDGVIRRTPEPEPDPAPAPADDPPKLPAPAATAKLASSPAGTTSAPKARTEEKV